MNSHQLEFCSFWHGGALPPHCLVCLRSFIKRGHRFTLYCYQHIDVPPGVMLRDAEEILPQSSIFFYEKGPGVGSISAFSNVFRYKLLADKGGWWVDVDVFCMSDTAPTEDIVFGWESSELLGTAVIRLPFGHSLSKRLFQTAMSIVKDRGSDLQWGEIGPRMFLRLVSEAGLLPLAKPAHVFYPLEWTEALLMLLPDRRDELLEKTKNSTFLHLWNEVFRRNNLDVSTPPDGSFIASIFSKYA